MVVPSVGFFVAGGVPPLLIGVIYALGARRRAGVERPVSLRRHSLFAAGLILFLLSMEWPFASWAHELFSVHQIGIMVARIVAPILIVASRPAGLLIAGLPPRRGGGCSSRAFRRRSSAMHGESVAHPLVATGALCPHPLFLGISGDAGRGRWPRRRSGSPCISACWRPASCSGAGSSSGGRRRMRRATGGALMMIWIAVLGQILIGAYLTAKEGIYYPFYAPTQRLLGVPGIGRRGDRRLPDLGAVQLPVAAGFDRRHRPVRPPRDEDGREAQALDALQLRHPALSHHRRGPARDDPGQEQPHADRPASPSR